MNSTPSQVWSCKSSRVQHHKSDDVRTCTSQLSRDRSQVVYYTAITANSIYSLIRCRQWKMKPSQATAKLNGASWITSLPEVSLWQNARPSWAIQHRLSGSIYIATSPLYEYRTVCEHWGQVLGLFWCIFLVLGPFQTSPITCGTVVAFHSTIYNTHLGVPQHKRERVRRLDVSFPKKVLSEHISE
jgi:hypothetical protein